MAQMPVGFDAIAVAAPVPLALQVPGLFEVGDNALHGAFGDADAFRDIAQQNFGIARDQQEHMRVIAEEGPPRDRRSFLPPCHRY